MVDLFLHAEPRRRSELLHGVLDGAALPLVAAIGRLSRVLARDGQGGAGVGATEAARADRGSRAAPALRCAQHRPQSEAVGGDGRALGLRPFVSCWLVVVVVEVEPSSEGPVSTKTYSYFTNWLVLITNGFI